MRKINSFIALIIVSNILFLSGCQTGQIKAPEVLAELDFSVDEGHIILSIDFEGQEYPFALDTGASHIIFDVRFRDKLGKPFLWPIPFSLPMKLANNKTIKGEFFSPPNAKIGPLRLKGPLFVRVCNFDLLPVDKKERNFEGLIGMDFLKKYIVRIDFDNRKVAFLEGKKEFDLFSMFKPKENKHPEWGEPLPLKTKLFPKNCYYIEGNVVEDIETDFLIDSGWDGPDALDKRVLERIYSCITKGIQDVNMPSYIVEPLSDEKEIMESFSVGSLEYKNKVFLKNDYSVLGLDFLSRHLVTFDFPNEIMYLKKGKKFDKPPSIFTHFGGCVINHANFEVVEADPNGPAYEKGIREKDILTKINNQDISYMGIVEFQKSLPKLLVSKDGKRTWTFKRGDETFTVEFVRKSGKEIPREK